MSRLRAACALAVGAAVGGILVSSYQFSAVHLGLGGGHYAGTLGGAEFYALAGSVIYAIGLLVVTPIWLWLDSRGHRDPWLAALCGAALSFAAPTLFMIAINVQQNRVSEIFSAQTVLEFLVPVAVIGVIVGLVVWRIAYRRLYHDFSNFE
jgi:hypothetical protein